jgi:hypothetical protein
MASELDETYGGGAPPAVPVVAVIENTEDEIDLVSEQVAVLGIEDEERHDQIMEGVNECRQRLESLSTLTQTAESPLLSEIMTEIREIRSQLSDLQKKVIPSSNMNPSNLPQSESTETPAIVVLEEQNREELTGEPSAAVKKKYRKL